MPAIILTANRVHATRGFLQKIYDQDDDIWLALASDGGWTTSPPAPADARDDYDTFWGNLIGGAKVSTPTHSELVIPRKTWTLDNVYVPFDSSDASSWSARDFYVVNSENRVYECIAANVAGLSKDEPSSINDNGGTTTGVLTNGYNWKYLYTIGSSADVGQETLTTDWMPVPNTAPAWNTVVYSTGDLVTDTEDRIWICTSTTGSAAVGTGPADSTEAIFAIHEIQFDLGAFYVQIVKAFPDSIGTGGKIGDDGVSYNQVAVLKNPNWATSEPAGGFASPADFEASLTNYDIMMLLDNRSQISRAQSQSETVRVTLEF